MTIKIVPLDSTHEFFKIPYPAPGQNENAYGFGIGQPFVGGELQPTFEWIVKVRIEGKPSDECNSIQLGHLQVVRNFKALVTWQGPNKTRTIWLWYLVDLPGRDRIGGYRDIVANAPLDSVWYNPTFRTVSQCGDTQELHFFDSPTLIKNENQPPGYVPGKVPQEFMGVIPWDDPRTGSKNSVQSLIWEAGFVTWLVAYDPSKNLYTPLRTVMWDFSLIVKFTSQNPIGSRGTIVSSKVDGPVSAKDVKIGSIEKFTPDTSTRPPAVKFVRIRQNVLT